MLATKCDRCQKFFEGKQLPKIRYRHGDPNSDVFELDICEECLENFFGFIKRETEGNRPVGEWIYDKEINGCCSICQHQESFLQAQLFNFCPKCGAKMLNSHENKRLEP